nr:hypothetical protein [[Eubacterium] tenue]
MINKKIIDIMESLQIPCYYQECNNRKDYYVLFNIFLEKDIEVADNISQATTYYITINYWYKKDCKDLVKYKEIKQAMKSNGFKFDDINDVVGNTHFCKSMDFIIKEWN